MIRKYQVTYRIHNGYQYYDPKYFTTTTEIIEAKNRDQAFETAKARAETPSLIAHDSVTVLKKDVIPLKPEKKRYYNVTLYFHTNVTVRVKAANEEEAIMEAHLEAGKKKYDANLINNMQEDMDPDVQEI